nr:hypothetical protein [Tanacetum cinerariifolium]
KPIKSEGFKKIIDFINANPIKYALTINPIVYTSCIEQFWATAKKKNVNAEVQIQALVDKKKVIITEASIKRDLRFEDEGGVNYLSNEVIFEQLTLMGEIPNEEVVPTTSNDSLPSGEDRMLLNELMILCTNLQKQVLDLEDAKTAQAKEIASLKKRVKKLEQKRKSRTLGLKILRKVGSARRVESSTEASLGDQEDASKQRRLIDNIDQDVEVILVDDTHGRMNEEDMFGVNDLDSDEVVVDVSASEKVEQSVKVIEKEVSTADPVTTAGEVVTTAEIKAAKPKAIITAATTVTAAGIIPKAKGIVIKKAVEGSEKAEEGSSKREGSNIEQEDVKRQRLEEENEIVMLGNNS